MAQLKHIAIRTEDVEKTAAFYRQVFGLKQVGAGQSGVYLTDGHLNIAILKLRPGADGERLRLGLDHFGFQVDDVEATAAAIERWGGKSLSSSAVKQAQTNNDDARAHSYFEVKCLGPDEQVIDISKVGWSSARS
jgi:catechol 2,3-dioxygenase-like lactoylglutathione lyase family enzyme